MFVHPDYQRQGIASRLLLKAEEYVRIRQGVSVYSEVSITARPFLRNTAIVSKKNKQYLLVT